MGLQDLLIELRRPHAGALLSVYVVSVALLLLVLAGAWFPVQRAAQAAQEERLLGEREQYLRDNLRQLLPQAAAVDRILPGLSRRSQWRGPVTAFSGAVLDAANVTGITILEESNEIEDVGDRAIYTKMLGFQASVLQLESFLKALEGLEMLVIASAVTMRAGDPPQVTLRLTAFSAEAP